jgi:hypothetical protein
MLCMMLYSTSMLVRARTGLMALVEVALPETMV